MAIEFNIELMQVFPVVGHSYSTCDRNFANFTKKLKRIQTIEHPDEYVKILKDLKFKVLKSKIYNWKSIFQKNTTNNKVEIAKCVQILYKTDGSVVTFHEYEKPKNHFTLIESKIIDWENKLVDEKDYFVPNEKLNDVKKLLKYLKPKKCIFL